MGGHDDHHHHGDCAHENSGVDPSEMGIMYSLYQKIDIDHVVCLNEEEEDSGKTIFKAWENRLDKEKVNTILIGQFRNSRYFCHFSEA